MGLNRKTAVIGTAIAAPPPDDPRSLEELLYDVTQAALIDAGMSIEAIDGIVVGSNDQFDGRAISVMMASGSVGGELIVIFYQRLRPANTPLLWRRCE